MALSQSSNNRPTFNMDSIKINGTFSKAVTSTTKSRKDDSMQEKEVKTIARDCFNLPIDEEFPSLTAIDNVRVNDSAGVSYSEILRRNIKSNAEEKTTKEAVGFTESEIFKNEEMLLNDPRTERIEESMQENSTKHGVIWRQTSLTATLNDNSSNAKSLQDNMLELGQKNISSITSIDYEEQNETSTSTSLGIYQEKVEEGQSCLDKSHHDSNNLNYKRNSLEGASETSDIEDFSEMETNLEVRSSSSQQKNYMEHEFIEDNTKILENSQMSYKILPETCSTYYETCPESAGLKKQSDKWEDSAIMKVEYCSKEDQIDLTENIFCYEEQQTFYKHLLDEEDEDCDDTASLQGICGCWTEGKIAKEPPRKPNPIIINNHDSTIDAMAIDAILYIDLSKNNKTSLVALEDIDNDCGCLNLSDASLSETECIVRIVGTISVYPYTIRNIQVRPDGALKRSFRYGKTPVHNRNVNTIYMSNRYHLPAMPAQEAFSCVSTSDNTVHSLNKQLLHGEPKPNNIVTTPEQNVIEKVKTICAEMPPQIAKKGTNGTTTTKQDNTSIDAENNNEPPTPQLLNGAAARRLEENVPDRLTPPSHNDSMPNNQISLSLRAGVSPTPTEVIIPTGATDSPAPIYNSKHQDPVPPFVQASSGYRQNNTVYRHNSNNQCQRRFSPTIYYLPLPYNSNAPHAVNFGNRGFPRIYNNIVHIPLVRGQYNNQPIYPSSLNKNYAAQPIMPIPSIGRQQVQNTTYLQYHRLANKVANVMPNRLAKGDDPMARNKMLHQRNRTGHY